MNTLFFYRARRQPNTVMAMFELSRGRLLKRRGERVASSYVAAEARHPSSMTSASDAEMPSMENTSFTDRVTLLRTLVSRHLGVPVAQVHDRLALHHPHFAAQSLLALAAAIDLQFGVYFGPERFGTGMTVAKLVELAVGTVKVS